MLRAKSIPAFLEQANTDGMRATMLLQVRLAGLSCGHITFYLPPFPSGTCVDNYEYHVRRRRAQTRTPSQLVYLFRCLDQYWAYHVACTKLQLPFVVCCVPSESRSPP